MAGAAETDKEQGSERTGDAHERYPSDLGGERVHSIFAEAQRGLMARAEHARGKLGEATRAWREAKADIQERAEAAVDEVMSRAKDGRTAGRDAIQGELAESGASGDQSARLSTPNRITGPSVH